MSVCIHHTSSPVISQEEKQLLKEISGANRYPVCRFELRSSREDELISTALDAVIWNGRMRNGAGEGTRQLLKSLEEKGLLVLYYNLKSYVKKDYQPYHDSDLFHLLEQLVAEGSQREGYLFDYAFVKKGMAVLTCKGKYAIR